MRAINPKKEDMHLYRSLPSHWDKSNPVILSIGNFDGIHIGHLAILERVKQLAKLRQAQSAVLTFSNHPSAVLRPKHPTPLLCTIEHKTLLIEKAKIDHLILLPFTVEFSQQTPEQFLNTLMHEIPFTALIFGSDGTIGKNREGDRSTIQQLAKKLRFDVEYLTDCKIDNERVSSTKIRTLIQEGKLKEAAKFFGRPYSIYAQVIKGQNRGAAIGFPTANISVEGLCLPPLGVYAINLIHKNHRYPGVANLGIAPTVRQDNIPVLEVHLFDQQVDLYDEFVDVHFEEYIRPERRFDSLEQLKEQIARDIKTAKATLNRKILL